MTDKKEQEETVSVRVASEHAGKRLDQVLALLFPDFSRSQLQQWVREGHVCVDARVPRNRDKVAGGETIILEIPLAKEADWEPQAIPLDIVYKDDAILVIDKPAGLVVHPGAGNPRGTLLNALLYHLPQLATLARAGIVHRLDKNTSGLMVIAKTEPARLNLIKQLAGRTLKRDYMAIVNGVMISGGTIEAPIGRHPRDRTRMAVHERGKPAVSHYRVSRRYRAHTLVTVSLESGRTHQIRVHMAYLRHAVIGDPVYGGRLRMPPNSGPNLQQALRGFKRQALHATRLALVHPITGETLEWERPPPADMQQLIEALQEDLDASPGVLNSERQKL